MIDNEKNSDQKVEVRRTMFSSPLFQILSSEQRQEAIKSDTLFSTKGISALIYISSLSLNREQLNKLSEFYSRKINNQWLIKKPRKDIDRMAIPSSVVLDTDFLTSHLQWVRPFTVVSTMIEDNNNPSERVLLMEQVKALSLDNESDRQCLDTKDLGRAIYQTLMIGHSMNENNCRAADFGKEIYFLKNENPPRVIAFDLASPTKLPTEGKERAKEIIEDQKSFLGSLKTTINKLNPEEREKIMKVLIKPEDSFRSLMEIAKDLNKEFGGEFEQEYLQIVQQTHLQPDTTWNRFTKEDIQMAQTEIRDYKQKIMEEIQKDEERAKPYLEKIGIDPKKNEFDPESEFGKGIVEAIGDPKKVCMFGRILAGQISLSLEFKMLNKSGYLKERLENLGIIAEQLHTLVPGENKEVIQIVLDRLFSQTPEDIG